MTIKVFNLVKDVLDENFDEILDGTTEEKLQKIKTGLNQMSSDFEQLRNKPGPNYSDPFIQFGYVFRYVTYKANQFPAAFRACPELAQLVHKPSLNVCCLGGGPGSDIVGIAKHLQSLVNVISIPSVHFWLCDREQGWADWWGNLDTKTEAAGLKMGTTFLPHDALDPSTWVKNKKWLQADLFTLSFFMSELFSRKTDAERYFDHVFSGAKQGALFLFIDNAHSEFTDWFDALVVKHGLKPVCSSEGRQVMPGDEQSDSLGIWNERLGSPRLQGTVASRVVTKP